MIRFQDPKSHRLIEKRRRDRMNACLNELLQLTPHETIDNQRRIEKTEIIEMAIKHVKHLISTLHEKCNKQTKTIRKEFCYLFLFFLFLILAKTTMSNLDSYRTGYRNGLSDVFDFLDQYSDSDQLLAELTEYFKEKEIDLKSLTGEQDFSTKRMLIVFLLFRISRSTR